jgi:LuxR family maltose regulon positive regulatory protein
MLRLSARGLVDGSAAAACCGCGPARSRLGRWAALLRSLISARQRGHVPAVSGAAQDHVNRVVRAFGSTLREAAASADAADGQLDPLTNRELEVLRFIAAGKRNSDIAQELVVTLETVKKHVSNILGKLGASSRTQAVALARELGLIS